VKKREEIESKEGVTADLLYLFSLLDNIKGRTGYFSVDVAQIG